jgi:rhodanese-related sulfurtransferase
MFALSSRADEKTNAPAAVTHIAAKEAAKLVEKGGVTVLDLRTPKEFATSHIAGATNIDCQAGDFADRLGKLDREQPYLIHCGSGRRSTNALPEFEKLGFKHIIHLDGGLKGWEAAKNPVAQH